MSFKDIGIPELINLVASKCDLSTINKLSHASNELQQMIDPKIKIEKIKNIFPICFHPFINFGSEFILNSQNIELGDKYGMTGYIDFIRQKHFINEHFKTNIVYGYDASNRFFISILYYDVLVGKYKIITVFQRYSLDPTFFVSCQNTFIVSSFCATIRLTNPADVHQNVSEVYRILFKLMNDGNAKYDEDAEKIYNYELKLPV
jgi:hypothetical protein